LSVTGRPATCRRTQSAVTAAAMAQRQEPGALAGGRAAIGLGRIVGTVIEPVTRRPRSWSPGIRLAIGVSLAASAALIGAVPGMGGTARRQHHEY
jgi:hypothetical protein